MKNFEKVIVRMPFQGNIQTWINEDGTVAYHEGETLEQYLAANPELQAITWDEYNKLHADFNRKPFREITEEQYNNMLECLPPMQWHDLNSRYNVFFCSEAMSGVFHGCYLYDRQTRKFYAGQKSRFVSDAKLIEDINNEIQ